MSRFAMIPADVRQVYGQLSGTALKVLLELCFHADAKGHAFPSISTICRNAGISRTSACDGIRQLEDAGLVTVKRCGGSQSRYVVKRPTPTSPEIGPVQQLDQSRNWTTPVQKLDRTSPEIGPVPVQKLDSNKNQLTRTTNKNQLTRSAFADWWSVYPRKADKGKAAKAYPKAIKAIAKERQVTEQDAAAWLLKVTQRFAASDKGRSGRFCPYGATWLNGERYADDPATWSESQPQDRQQAPPRSSSLIVEQTPAQIEYLRQQRELEAERAERRRQIQAAKEGTRA